MSSTKRLHSIDVLKTVAAFFVCFQHACGSGWLSDYILAISKIAVPLFIMITGYMYRDTKARNHEKDQIKRFFSIGIIMGLIWLLIDLCFHYVKHDLSGYCSQFFDANNIIRFLLFNDPIAADHAWYIWAMIYVLGLMFIFPCLPQNRAYQRIIIILGLSGLLLLGRYSFVFSKTFPYYYIRNFICEGLPFFFIGIKLRNMEEAGKSLNRSAYFILTASCLTLQIVECFILSMTGHLTVSGTYVMTPGLAIAVFLLFAVGVKDRVDENNIFARIGRNHSLLIYIIHPLFVRIEKHFIDMDSWWQYIGVLFVFSAALVTAIVYGLLRKRIRHLRRAE